LINLFRSHSRGTRDFYDNWNSRPRSEDRSAWIQTQLLKLYFLTTLYVDVKEPALASISGDKKNSISRRRWSSFPIIMPGQNWVPICSPKCT